ncbi:MAG: hypothetical protein HN712_20565 [Gemmatimonadetes bacterium]|jgi:hypothetical protein|nr:hypothetical protein [Gemmatimonadota bacterium]MBT6145050.1 hypothetical protein [Gemmatimonadota bacterium]MBT7862720.1 hypothetical protein [Gemmatimonadota bacterium]
MNMRHLLPPSGTAIALACCASRPSFVAVTAQLLRRLRQQGLLDRYHIDLIVVHADLNQLAVDDLIAATEDLPGTTALRALRLVEENTPSYATRRNRALAAALQSDARYLFFYDDDEHWVRPSPPDLTTRPWRHSDPLVPHLASLCAGAVITCGAILGQRSPIPACLPQQTDQRMLRELGHVMRLGSEFLHRRSFVEDAGRWHWQPSCRLDAPMLTRRGILPLTGSNLTLDLQAVRAGWIPPYSNPPGARGEDALLGARIRHLPVRRVSSCSFHDPFQQMSCDEVGEPLVLSQRSEDPRADLQRFAAALCGWVNYAPMLVRLGGGVRVGLDGAARLDTMQHVLDDVAPVLAADLGVQQLARLPDLLARRRQGCDRDWEDMQRAVADWKRSAWRADGRC